MAALTPATPDALDVTSIGKIRIWFNPVFASADTVTVPGIKEVFSITNAKTGVVGFVSSSYTAGGLVVHLTVSASSTGDRNPLVVYGR